MSKQKIKKLIKFQRNIIIFLIFVIGIWIWVVISAAFPKISIPNKAFNNTDLSSISIKYQNVLWKWAYYVNNRNNSTIIGNYFEWYYYDKLYWSFKLDWSGNKNENVRVINWTNRCSTWYWYNLWWKAKSENWWFIDFAWVYYCLSDKELHWKGYNKYTWYQDFEWIAFEIITKSNVNIIKDTNDIFVNDNNTVDEKNELEWGDTETANAWGFKIWWNEFYIDDKTESIFYIIK